MDTNTNNDNNNVNNSVKDYKDNNKTLEFKPNIKIELIKSAITFGIIILLVIIISITVSIFTSTAEALFSIPFIIIGIIFFAIIGSAAQIITLVVTKYTISKDNELIISQNLLSKSSKVYRIDQITSIERTQGWLQKKFNLHSIKFNIFGGSSIINSQSGQQGYALLPIFKNVEHANTTFEEILSRMNTTPQEVQYTTSPKPTPKLVSIILNMIFLFIAIGIIFLGSSLNLIQVTIGGLIATLIIFTILLGNCIDYMKLKKTYFNLFEDSASLTYNYIFKNAEHITPYRKITNVSRYKTLFQHLVFKISNIRLYTGGERDQMFFNVSNNSTLFEIFSYLVKDKKNMLNKNIISTIKSNQEKPMKILKPGLSFIIQPLISTIIYSTIFIIAIIIAYNYVQESTLQTFIIGGAILGIFIGVFKLLVTFIQWRNIKYELFKDKIVITYGVLSIVSSEIYINNIKYVSLNIPFYLQRVFGEGTLSIYTAGKNSRDGVLRRIPHATYYYKQLQEAINNN